MEELRRSPSLGDPLGLVHAMLFVVEYSGTLDFQSRTQDRSLHFFLSRDGGLHLFLLLLNAYYSKPPAGRRPGWVFTTLRERVRISERSLRTLIHDALDEGYIVQLPIVAHDRRYRSYSLAPSVVATWETMTALLEKSVSATFEAFDPSALANVDYCRWNPDLPAARQTIKLPPSRSHALK